MPMPTGYQYAKLGSNLEYLRGISSASLAETISLDAFPDLQDNVPPRRYAVANVVEVLRSLVVQLGELQLPLSSQAARAYHPMLKEMEAFLATSPSPRTAYLTDVFAQRLVVVAKQVILAARKDLSVPFLTPIERKPAAENPKP